MSYKPNSTEVAAVEDVLAEAFSEAPDGFFVPLAEDCLIAAHNAKLGIPQGCCLERIDPLTIARWEQVA